MEGDKQFVFLREEASCIDSRMCEWIKVCRGASERREELRFHDGSAPMASREDSVIIKAERLVHEVGSMAAAVIDGSNA